MTNPADLHAIEAALTLSDEVWALSMGPPNAEAALREAVALGVTRAPAVRSAMGGLGHLGHVQCAGGSDLPARRRRRRVVRHLRARGETGALAHDMRELPIRSEDPLEARNRIR